MANKQKEILEAVMQIQKSELVKRLVSFVCGDTVLYLFDSPLASKSLLLVNHILGTSFTFSQGIEAVAVSSEQIEKLEKYFENLPIEKVALLYLVATEMHSVFLGILFVENRLTIEEIFNCAFYEELQQQKKWGTMPEVITLHNETKSYLQWLQEVRDAGSIS